VTPMPTYQLGPQTRSRADDAPRRALACEVCRKRLGRVYSPLRHDDLSAGVAAALWPEMTDALARHDKDCRGCASGRPPA